MVAFFSKVFSRKKGEEKEKDDKHASGSSSKARPPAPSLLEGKFEAISPTVSPSAEKFAADAERNVRGKEKEKEKGLGLLRSVSRSKSPSRAREDAPRLTLNLPGPKEDVRGRALGAVFEAGPDELAVLDENIIQGRRLTLLQTLLLVRECSQIITSRGLETLGIMHPHWHSESAEVQKKLVSLFIQSLEPKTPATALVPTPTAVLAAFESELNYVRDLHDVGAVFRWGLRHLELEGNSFGKDSSDLAWYDAFTQSERDMSFPPKAFMELLIPQLPTSHAELLQAMLDIITSLAAHAEMNSSSGSKLSMLFGLYLLSGGLTGPVENWKAFYDKWDRSGQALEHIYLSYIRYQSVVEKLPKRLSELVTNYPYSHAGPSEAKAFSRPRFSTRRYYALYVSVNSEIASGTAKPKDVHPLAVVTDALKSDLAGEGEFRDAWETIRKTTEASNQTEGDAASDEGYRLLSSVFSDETIRSLSLRPLEGDVTTPTITMFTPTPRHMRRRSSSVGAPVIKQKISIAHSSSPTTPSAKAAGKARAEPELPPSPIASDWNLFSTTGFGEPTPQSLHIAETLWDNEIEKTQPAQPSLLRKSSGKRHSRRSSYDYVASPIRRETSTKTISCVSTASSVVQLDEAFIDFWNDALLDSVSSSWPSFVLCQLKEAAGIKIEDKPITWLVIEQIFTVQAPLSPVPASPVTTQISPRPSLRSQAGSEKRQRSSRVSSTFTATRKRFNFFGTHHDSSLPSNIESVKDSGKSSRATRVGEMGEIIQEETPSASQSVVPVPVPVAAAKVKEEPVPSTETDRTVKDVTEVAAVGAVAAAAAVAAVAEVEAPEQPEVAVKPTDDVQEEVPVVSAPESLPRVEPPEQTADELATPVPVTETKELEAQQLSLPQPLLDSEAEPSSQSEQEAPATHEVFASEATTTVAPEQDEIPKATQGLSNQSSFSTVESVQSRKAAANLISINRGADGSKFIEHIPTPPEYSVGEEPAAAATFPQGLQPEGDATLLEVHEPEVVVTPSVETVEPQEVVDAPIVEPIAVEEPSETVEGGLQPPASSEDAVDIASAETTPTAGIQTPVVAEHVQESAEPEVSLPSEVEIPAEEDVATQPDLAEVHEAPAAPVEPSTEQSAPLEEAESTNIPAEIVPQAPEPVREDEPVAAAMPVELAPTPSESVEEPAPAHTSVTDVSTVDKISSDDIIDAVPATGLILEQVQGDTEDIIAPPLSAVLAESGDDIPLEAPTDIPLAEPTAEPEVAEDQVVQVVHEDIPPAADDLAIPEATSDETPQTLTIEPPIATATDKISQEASVPINEHNEDGEDTRTPIVEGVAEKELFDEPAVAEEEEGHGDVVTDDTEPNLDAETDVAVPAIEPVTVDPVQLTVAADEVESGVEVPEQPEDELVVDAIPVEPLAPVLEEPPVLDNPVKDSNIPESTSLEIGVGEQLDSAPVEVIHEVTHDEVVVPTAEEKEIGEPSIMDEAVESGDDIPTASVLTHDESTVPPSEPQEQSPNVHASEPEASMAEVEEVTEGHATQDSQEDASTADPVIAATEEDTDPAPVSEQITEGAVQEDKLEEDQDAEVFAGGLATAEVAEEPPVVEKEASDRTVAHDAEIVVDLKDEAIASVAPAPVEEASAEAALAEAVPAALAEVDADSDVREPPAELIADAPVERTGSSLEEPLYVEASSVETPAAPSATDDAGSEQPEPAPGQAHEEDVATQAPEQEEVIDPSPSIAIHAATSGEDVPVTSVATVDSIVASTPSELQETDSSETAPEPETSEILHVPETEDVAEEQKEALEEALAEDQTAPPPLNADKDIHELQAAEPVPPTSFEEQAPIDSIPVPAEAVETTEAEAVGNVDSDVPILAVEERATTEQIDQAQEDQDVQLEEPSEPDDVAVPSTFSSSEETPGQDPPELTTVEQVEDMNQGEQVVLTTIPVAAEIVAISEPSAGLDINETETASAAAPAVVGESPLNVDSAIEDNVEVENVPTDISKDEQPAATVLAEDEQPQPEPEVSSITAEPVDVSIVEVPEESMAISSGQSNDDSIITEDQENAVAPESQDILASPELPHVTLESPPVIADIHTEEDSKLPAPEDEENAISDQTEVPRTNAENVESLVAEDIAEKEEDNVPLTAVEPAAADEVYAPDQHMPEAQEVAPVAAVVALEDESQSKVNEPISSEAVEAPESTLVAADSGVDLTSHLADDDHRISAPDISSSFPADTVVLSADAQDLAQDSEGGMLEVEPKPEENIPVSNFQTEIDTAVPATGNSEEIISALPETAISALPETAISALPETATDSSTVQDEESSRVPDTADELENEVHAADSVPPSIESEVSSQELPSTTPDILDETVLAHATEPEVHLPTDSGQPLTLEDQVVEPVQVSDTPAPTDHDVVGPVASLFPAASLHEEKTEDEIVTSAEDGLADVPKSQVDAVEPELAGTVKDSPESNVAASVPVDEERASVEPVAQLTADEASQPSILVDEALISTKDEPDHEDSGAVLTTTEGEDDGPISSVEEEGVNRIESADEENIVSAKVEDISANPTTELSTNSHEASAADSTIISTQLPESTDPPEIVTQQSHTLAETTVEVTESGPSDVSEMDPTSFAPIQVEANDVDTQSEPMQGVQDPLPASTDASADFNLPAVPEVELSDVHTVPDVIITAASPTPQEEVPQPLTIEPHVTEETDMGAPDPLQTNHDVDDGKGASTELELEHPTDVDNVENTENVEIAAGDAPFQPTEPTEDSENLVSGTPADKGETALTVEAENANPPPSDESPTVSADVAVEIPKETSDSMAPVHTDDQPMQANSDSDETYLETPMLMDTTPALVATEADLSLSVVDDKLNASTSAEAPESAEVVQEEPLTVLVPQVVDQAESSVLTTAGDDIHTPSTVVENAPTVLTSEAGEVENSSNDVSAQRKLGEVPDINVTSIETTDKNASDLEEPAEDLVKDADAPLTSDSIRTILDEFRPAEDTDINTEALLTNDSDVTSDVDLLSSESIQLDPSQPTIAVGEDLNDQADTVVEAAELAVDAGKDLQEHLPPYSSPLPVDDAPTSENQLSDTESLAVNHTETEATLTDIQPELLPPDHDVQLESAATTQVMPTYEDKAIVSDEKVVTSESAHEGPRMDTVEEAIESVAEPAGIQNHTVTDVDLVANDAEAVDAPSQAHNDEAVGEPEAEDTEIVTAAPEPEDEERKDSEAIAHSVSEDAGSNLLASEPAFAPQPEIEGRVEASNEDDITVEHDLPQVMPIQPDSDGDADANSVNLKIHADDAAVSSLPTEEVQKLESAYSEQVETSKVDEAVAPTLEVLKSEQNDEIIVSQANTTAEDELQPATDDSPEEVATMQHEEKPHNDVNSESKDMTESNEPPRTDGDTLEELTSAADAVDEESPEDEAANDISEVQLEPSSDTRAANDEIDNEEQISHQAPTEVEEESSKAPVTADVVASENISSVVEDGIHEPDVSQTEPTTEPTDEQPTDTQSSVVTEQNGLGPATTEVATQETEIADSEPESAASEHVSAGDDANTKPLAVTDVDPPIVENDESSLNAELSSSHVEEIVADRASEGDPSTSNADPDDPFEHASETTQVLMQDEEPLIPNAHDDGISLPEEQGVSELGAESSDVLHSTDIQEVNAEAKNQDIGLPQENVGESGETKVLSTSDDVQDESPASLVNVAQDDTAHISAMSSSEEIQEREEEQRLADKADDPPLDAHVPAQVEATHVEENEAEGNDSSKDTGMHEEPDRIVEQVSGEHNEDTLVPDTETPPKTDLIQHVEAPIQSQDASKLELEVHNPVLTEDETNALNPNQQENASEADKLPIQPEPVSTADERPASHIAHQTPTTDEATETAQDAI